MGKLIQIVLASQSETRKQQLNRIGLEFVSCNPDVDESILTGESADALVSRLSFNKALAVAGKYNNHLIIAGDQVMSLGKDIIGKPKNTLDAQQHLLNCSGKIAIFYTGICVLNSQNNTHFVQVLATKVKFRELNLEIVNKYLKLDSPYSCAGSIQMESAGMLLVERVYANDPFAMLGLPITALNDLFLQHGLNLIDYCFIT